MVITAGKQTKDEGAYTPVDEVSRRLQGNGSAVFVLGIGEEVDPSELNEIASGPKNVFTVDSFEDLEDKVDEIKRGICVKGILYNFSLLFTHGIYHSRRYQFSYWPTTIGIQNS